MLLAYGKSFESLNASPFDPNLRAPVHLKKKHDNKTLGDFVCLNVA